MADIYLMQPRPPPQLGKQKEGLEVTGSDAFGAADRSTGAAPSGRATVTKPVNVTPRHQRTPPFLPVVEFLAEELFE